MSPDEEEDRTVVRPTGAGTTLRVTQPMSTGSVPPTVATSQHSHTLPAGTRLGEFEVTSTLGEGGFGIVYLAWDHSLDRKIALKEYMPSSIAFRVGATEIRPRSERHLETFEAGMKSFINEAKLLAQFDHPALVKVYRFWEANGTAYMIMPFYEGKTLRDTVRALPHPPDEAWIRALLEPLFHALSMLHAAQCFHRDIAPDNVMLLAENGRPLLLDFGAARRVIGDMTQALTAILKPGYAPVEQYAEVPGLKQGAWTDVYALAAVVHWLITSKTPPASVGRMFGDSYVPLAQRAAGQYGAQFLAAVDRALAVRPEDRTPTIEALRADMAAADSAPAAPLVPVAQPQPGSAPPRTVQGGAVPPRTVQRDATPVRTVQGGTPQPRTVAPAASGSTRDERWPTTVESVPATRRPVPVPAAATPRRWPLLAALGGIVVVVLAAGAWWASRPAPVAVPPAISHDTRPITPAETTPASQAQTAPIAQTPPAIVEPAPATASAPSAAVVEAAASPVVARPVEANPNPLPRKPAVPRVERHTDTAVAQPPPAETRPTARNNNNADRDAECARLFQRLSIGESNQDLIDRVKALRCR